MLENVKLVLFTLTLAANIQTLRSCARTKPGGGNSPTAPNRKFLIFVFIIISQIIYNLACINPSDTSGVINAVSNSNINSQNQAVGGFLILWAIISGSHRASPRHLHLY